MSMDVRTLPRSRKLRISCCLDVQLYCLSISSSEFRPPPHRKNQPDYSKQTVENLQLAYELACRNLRERADKQAVVNETLSFPSFKTGEQVLIHRPYNEADGPNPKLISHWRGPYTVRAQKSPVIYRVTKDGNPSEITVHLGRMKNTLSLYRPLSPTSMRSTIYI